MMLSLLCLGVLSLATAIGWAGDEHEEAVTLDQVPPAVKATILTESAGGRITEIERETKNGTTVYEAEFLRDGKEIEIKIASDGTLLGRDVEAEHDDDDLKLEEIPAPARAALRRLAGGATIVEVEHEREHGVLVYEAAWMTGGRKHEAAVTADGALIELEEVVRVDELPRAVRAAVAEHFPPDARLHVEKTMIVVYEIEAKVNGREMELHVFPTGRVHEGASEDDHDEDEDDDEEEEEEDEKD